MIAFGLICAVLGFGSGWFSHTLHPGHATLYQINHACAHHGGLDSMSVDGPVGSVGSFTVVYCMDTAEVVLP